MSVHIREFFSEPSGWGAARISLGSSLAFFSLYAYSELLHNSGGVAMLVFGVATGLSGIAELLPKSRRRAAIVLRVTAIAMLVVVGVSALRSLIA
ncbi:hypothetical protein JMJ58_12860 [Haloterrigena salifodinae]|uniref:Uncharacterized protein n=1 Tax=Haloterrigena salifodinae TaxID=2675099 RepID=A0A8T8DX38_9EURY|nr:hypothetical protein [Haloterrigena salifodinae]QRV13841.1 hypothetical protein JMJ58_12860 [Haloterrigena salifodinae]